MLLKFKNIFNKCEKLQNKSEVFFNLLSREKNFVLRKTLFYNIW